MSINILESVEKVAFLPILLTNETLVKWFNKPYYEYFTEEETKSVWEQISAHPEIAEISGQIGRELEALVEVGDFWGLS